MLEPTHISSGVSRAETGGVCAHVAVPAEVWDLLETPLASLRLLALGKEREHTAVGVTDEVAVDLELIFVPTDVLYIPLPHAQC